MFHPTNADLFDATVLDAECILRNDRVKGCVLIPTQYCSTDVATSGTERVAMDVHAVNSVFPVTAHAVNGADNDIGSSLRITGSAVGAAVSGYRHSRHLSNSECESSNSERSDEYACLHV